MDRTFRCDGGYVTDENNFILHSYDKSLMYSEDKTVEVDCYERKEMNTYLKKIKYPNTLLFSRGSFAPIFSSF